MLKFPKLGAIRQVPVFVEPQRPAEGVSDADWARVMADFEPKRCVTARVLMLDRPSARNLNHEFGALRAEQRKYAAEPEPVELTERWVAHMRRVVVACVRGVEGVEYDGAPLDRIEGAALADALEACELLHHVGLAGLRGQSPTGTEKDFFA